MTRSVYQALLSRWVPARCLFCDGAAREVDLCDRCCADLPVSAPAWRLHAPPLTATFSPWRYDYPVDWMVRSLKFHGDRCVARTLGILLAGQRAGLDTPLPQLLVPVPLHPARLRVRGYNQAEEIARYAAAHLGTRWLAALQRVRDTPEQSRLTAERRRENLANAFIVVPRLRARVQGVRIALIDDVLTTASTASAAATALRDARSGEIEVWTLARAEQVGQLPAP
jgi:ComF family protein